MNVNDILTLARAGFSAEQIAALNSPEPPAAAPEQPEAIPEAPATPPVPEQSSQPDYGEMLKALQQEIVGLKSAMQQTNINSIGLASAPAESVDDILARIINPKE